MNRIAIAHDGKDTLRRPIEGDRQYVLTRPGCDPVPVTTFEDEHGAIWISGLEERPCRLDELGVDVSLARINGEIARDKLGMVGDVLTVASEARQTLAFAESRLSELLGCQRGDGSPLWDGISAAVRDGMGTAVDLLDLSGGLRR